MTEAQSQDLEAELVARVAQAAASKTPLSIVGGGSKRFYGRRTLAASGAPAEGGGEELAVGGHAGIVQYEPTELVVKARAGTRVEVIEAALAEAGQMLAFEPPRFGASATIGGTVATNLSGPRRPYAGAARDHVLGVTIVNGRGEKLRFGGEVIKNVAGYDLARLMAGALGTLGVLLDVSLKVVPAPRREETRAREVSVEQALATLIELAGRPTPLSAACFEGGRLVCRFSGSESAVGAAVRAFGGEAITDGRAFWTAVREQEHPFFAGEGPLWRLSVPAETPRLAVDGACFYDWGGAQRWVRGDADAATMRAIAAAAGGHATAFRGVQDAEPFAPLEPRSRALHERIKAALDPHGVLNPGRLYAGL